MTAITATPASHWSAQLSALTADVALALGPWLDIIDTVLTPVAESTGDDGEPDGYDGLSSRGTPERMLLSEWLLAAEEPDEFLRRATTGELMHVAPAFRRPETRARLLVLVDSGPALWGAPRLAQLAIILVLQRHADSRGLPLRIAHAGGTPGRWFGGTLASTLTAWQRYRHLATAGGDDLAAWRSTLTDDDEVWLLTGTGPDAGHSAPGLRTVTITESGWDAAGVAELTVTSGERRAVLPMPPAEQSLKALRGHGFRTASATTRSRHPAMRFPIFPNQSRWLLGRGPTNDSLVTVPLPDGRVRRHEIPGAVFAAGMTARRLVVLRHSTKSLLVSVIGKPMPQFRQAHWLYEDLPDLADRGDGPIHPLYVGADHLLVRVGEHWWRLQPGLPAERTDLIAVGPGMPPQTVSAAAYPDAKHAMIGMPFELIWSADGRTWVTRDDRIQVPDRDQVIGTTRIKSESVLLTLSPGGQILRLAGADGIRTLTRWSPVDGTPAVHTRMPWIAMTRADGDLIVADVEADTVIFRMRAGA